MRNSLFIARSALGSDRWIITQSSRAELNPLLLCELDCEFKVVIRIFKLEPILRSGQLPSISRQNAANISMKNRINIHFLLLKPYKIHRMVVTTQIWSEIAFMIERERDKKIQNECRNAISFG